MFSIPQMPHNLEGHASQPRLFSMFRVGGIFLSFGIKNVYFRQLYCDASTCVPNVQFCTTILNQRYLKLGFSYAVQNFVASWPLKNEECFALVTLLTATYHQGSTSKMVPKSSVTKFAFHPIRLCDRSLKFFLQCYPSHRIRSQTFCDSELQI